MNHATKEVVAQDLDHKGRLSPDVAHLGPCSATFASRCRGISPAAEQGEAQKGAD